MINPPAQHLHDFQFNGMMHGRYTQNTTSFSNNDSGIKVLTQAATQMMILVLFSETP